MAPNVSIRPTISFDEDDHDDYNTATALIESSSSSINNNTKLNSSSTVQNGSYGTALQQQKQQYAPKDLSVFGIVAVGIVVVGFLLSIAYDNTSLYQQANGVTIESLLQHVQPMSILAGNLLFYFFVIYITMGFLSMVLSSSLDDVYASAANKYWRRSDNKKQPITLADRTAVERPTSIGYNEQIQILTGIVMYSTVLLVLFYSDAKNTTLVNKPTCFVTNTMLDGITSRFGGSEYNDILFHVVGIIGIYTVFEYFWMPCLTSYGNFRGRTYCGLRFLESKALGPLLLITAFIIKDPFELVSLYITDTIIVFNTVRTVLYGWITFKIIDFTYKFFDNQRTIRISEYPKIFEDLPINKKRVKIAQGDTSVIDSTTQLGSPDANDVWNIYGNQYDVSAFVPFHPGGVETIMLAANREDATPLFQSYHPFNMKKARAVLEKYRINKDDNKDKEETTVATTAANKYLIQYGHENDIFYDVLCQRVAKVLQDDHIIHPIRDRGADTLRLTSYVIYIAVALFSFYKHCQGSIIYSMVFALFGGVCAAHIGHDGGHYAISSKYPLVNDIGIWAVFIITNPICWQHEHTYAHHSFTNHADKDPDLHHCKGAFKMRPNEHVGNHFMNIIDFFKSLDKDQKYFYWFLMFNFSQTSTGLSFIFPWVFVMDRSLHGVVPWSDRRQWHRTIQLFAHWVLYIVAVVILPYMAHAKTNPWMGFVQTLIHMTISSMFFALVTNVGHLSDVALNNDGIDAQRSKRHSIAQNSWAAEQVVVSQDFAPQSRLAFLFGGGLSMQIEHHLFPGFNHCHLPKIQPIVEATCKEYNVTYTKYETWYEAWAVTINYLIRVQKE